MTSPKNTLQFSIRTKQRVDVAPLLYKKNTNPVSVRSLTDGRLDYKLFKKPFKYSQEEVDWLEHQNEIYYQETPRDDPSWLKDRLKGQDSCTWCSNTLTLEFNSARSGFQVACSYCGMAGACESEATAAIDAFNQTAIL